MTTLIVAAWVILLTVLTVDALVRRPPKVLTRGFWVADAADWPTLAAAETEADQRRAAARAEWVDCRVAFAWVRVDCAVEAADLALWDAEVKGR